MNNKEKAAVLVREHEEKFRCPICHQRLKVTAVTSMTCEKNHTFDFAKQGYVNLLHRPVKTQYNRELFKARNVIIVESDLYGMMHQKVSKIISKNFLQSKKPSIILDAGSGEGSHLQRILETAETSGLIGVGLDISKEGIRMAASNYKEEIWFVGDLANIPTENKAVNIILNILSPANYLEFKRVLSHEGLMIKVVPGPDYLKELRHFIFNNTEKESYENKKTVALFKEHFHSVKVENLKYTKKLSTSELENLLQMTPLGWSAETSAKDELLSQEYFEITVDLDVLVGKGLK